MKSSARSNDTKPNTAVFSISMSSTSLGTTMVGPKKGAMDSQKKFAAHTPCNAQEFREPIGPGQPLLLSRHLANVPRGLVLGVVVGADEAAHSVEVERKLDFLRPIVSLLGVGEGEVCHAADVSVEEGGAIGEAAEGEAVGG